jgi:hypothetical protein
LLGLYPSRLPIGFLIVCYVSGKDDKFWGGQYGTMMSDAVVRVKRQTTPAEGDTFEDTVVSITMKTVDEDIFTR